MLGFTHPGKIEDVPGLAQFYICQDLLINFPIKAILITIDFCLSTGALAHRTMGFSGYPENGIERAKLLHL